MIYTLEIDLSLPRDKVVELFDNPSNMPEWQDSLISYQHLGGVPGQEGATARLVHRVGNREIEMTETVASRNLPDEFTGLYEAKGAWNRVLNRFIELGPNQTRWIFESELRCSGLLKIMGFLMPGMFKKASLKDMRRFKKFAESRAAAA